MLEDRLDGLLDGKLGNCSSSWTSDGLRLRSSKYSGLNSVELLNSVEFGLGFRPRGVEGESGAWTGDASKLSDRSLGTLGDSGVPGRRKRKGTAVDETGRRGMSGLLGDTGSCSGDRGGDLGSGGRSETLPTSMGDEGRLNGKGICVASSSLTDDKGRGSDNAGRSAALPATSGEDSPLIGKRTRAVFSVVGG